MSFPPSTIIPQLLDALQRAGKGCYKDLAFELDLAPSTVSTLLTRMHKRGLVHIVAWTRAGSTTTSCRRRAVYAAGPGTDKPEPRPRTDRRNISREYRRRCVEKILRLKGQVVTEAVAMRQLSAMRRLGIPV